MKGRKKEEKEIPGEIPGEVRLAYGLLQLNREFSGMFEKNPKGLRCTVCGRLVENGGGLGALLSRAKALHQECAEVKKIACRLGIKELPVTWGPKGWQCKYCHKSLAEEPMGHTIQSFLQKHNCCQLAHQTGIPLDAVHIERRRNADHLYYWAVVCNVCGEEVDVDGGWEKHKACAERAETVRTFLDEGGFSALTSGESSEKAEEPEELEELGQ
jgi:hypothetical protein